MVMPERVPEQYHTAIARFVLHLRVVDDPMVANTVYCPGILERRRWLR